MKADGFKEWGLLTLLGVQLIAPVGIPPLNATTIELRTGKRITGKILAFFEDHYLVRLQDEDIRIHEKDVERIVYDEGERSGGTSPGPSEESASNVTPEPSEESDASHVGMKDDAHTDDSTLFAGRQERRYLLDIPTAIEKPIAPNFSSPQNTFNSWRNAAVRMSVGSMVNCYAQSFRDLIRERLTKLSGEQLQAMAREARLTDFKIDKIVFNGQMAYVRVDRRLGEQADFEILNFIKEDGKWKLMP